jgi:hypothetical protein
MERFKTRELSRSVLEHLINIGYKSNNSIEELADSPYLLIDNYAITVCDSVKDFNNFKADLKTWEQVLKFRPKKEKEEFKKKDKKLQTLYKLLNLLNTKKVSTITGYDVSWAIQEHSYEKGRYEVLPISPHACGSISMEHLEVILDFAKKHPFIHPTLSYTDYNDNKKRYGTSRPCIYFY